VSFRLIVNGKPAANRALVWTLETADGGGETSSVHTDSNGVLSLERDGFVDPRHRASSLRLQSPELESAADEWLDVTVEPPADLDALTTVSIRTGALTVIIPPALLDARESEPPKFTVYARGDGDASDMDTAQVSGDMPVVSGRIEFPHLQHGRYEVWLQNGSIRYRSPEVEVGMEAATVTIPLDPTYSPDVDEPEDRAASPTNQPL
jgi:hypothetical protein